MSCSDTVAEFLTCIRNAARARHRYVDVHWSTLRQNIAQVLKDQGFVEHFLVRKDAKPMMRIFLRYTRERHSIIRGLVRVSTPGRRRYVGHERIPSVFNRLGVAIVSTSQGVLADAEARKKKVGGELLCYVW